MENLITEIKGQKVIQELFKTNTKVIFSKKGKYSGIWILIDRGLNTVDEYRYALYQDYGIKKELELAASYKGYTPKAIKEKVSSDYYYDEHSQQKKTEQNKS